MSNDPFILTDETTGNQYRISSPWYPTDRRHSNLWNNAGTLLSSVGKKYSLHKLGQLNRFRAVDNQHPYTQHFCELTHVQTPV